MLSLDLHTHTRFFHGLTSRSTPYDPLGARLLGAVANWRGLDGVALTNHDYYEPLDTGSVEAVPGIEVTTTKGHVLVVGPDPPQFTRPEELTPVEVVEAAHERGCAAIIAHPYRNSTVRSVEAPFDAIEVNGKHPRTRVWVRELAERHGLPMVGGSDAHYPLEVGRAYTEVRMGPDEFNPENVVRATRDGRVRPSVGNRLPDRLIRRLYYSIHSQKRQLDTPEWTGEKSSPGVGPPPGEND